MPFNPETGAWESGGDRPWQMPTTSAGDIIGGFNSAAVFKQNMDRQRLQQLLQELALQEGQYRYGREREQGAREDEFRAGLEPQIGAGSGMEYAPSIQSESDLDLGMMKLDPSKSYDVLNRRESQRDRLESSEAAKLFAELNKNIKASTMDPRDASAVMRSKYPRFENLAMALEGTKADPKIKPSIDKMGAATALMGAQKKRIEALTPLTEQGMRLKNDILRLKKAAGVDGGKSSGGIKDKLSIMRLQLQVMKTLASQDIKDSMLANDPEVYSAAIDAIKELDTQLETMNSSTQVSPAGPHTSPTPTKSDPLGVR